jgi:hypothetical protein
MVAASVDVFHIFVGGILILTAGLLVFAYWTADQRDKLSKKLRREETVKGDLSKNGYRLKVDHLSLQGRVDLDEKLFTVELPFISLHFRYDNTGGAMTRLYVYNDRGERMLIEPEDYNRYLAETMGWHRAVQADAGFTASKVG